MLRGARESDAEALARVHIASWQATYRGQIPDSHLDGLDLAAREEWFRRHITGDGSILVADSGGEPIGFCFLGPSRSEEDWGEIYAIYVAPSGFGAGHGHALITGAEHELLERGFEHALLWVLQANGRARQFYERHGWEKAPGIKIEEIGGVQVSEVRYQKRLRAPLAPDRGPRET